MRRKYSDKRGEIRMGMMMAERTHGMNWTSKISLVLVCTLVLCLCQLWQAPGEAEAAAAFQAAGTAVEGTTGSVSPAWPVHQANDIALLFVETAGGSTISLTTPNGFVPVLNSPQSTGTGTAGTKLAVYWARATSASMAAPVLSSSADHIYAVILTYRGITRSGTPFDITAGGVKATASASVSATGVTTTVPNALIVVGVTKDLDATTAFASGWTNANLTNITERFDAGTAQGLGGGIAVMDGSKTTAGATGNTSATVTSSINAFLTISLAPDSSVATCGGCHGYGSTFTDGTARNTPAGAFPGSHKKHVADYGKACSVCHVAPATETSADYAHRNGTILMASPINGNTGAAYTKGTSWAQTNSPTAFTGCTNTYCHSNGTSVITGTIPANTSTTWGGTTTCQSCHGAGGNDDGRPNYANNTPKRNTHGDGASYGVTHKATACPTCHTGVSGSAGAYTITSPAAHANSAYNLQASLGYTQSTGVCSTPGCHGSATWGGPALTCIDCHSSAQDAGDGAPTRRAVTSEFNNTWSHKRTAGGTVTRFDCGVCHMEGNPSTGVTTSFHKNNLLEFRDPDTGVTIKGVTFSGTPGSYASTATDATAATFARNTGSSTLEAFAQAVQVNLCLKCHDANGANSTSARVSGGTATQPFGTSAGTIVNVDAHFATTNSSYHPVKGKNNNSYADATTMVAPWNGITKTDGTTATYGDLITCWDCHDSSAAGRAIGGVTASVTAHGASTTLRGNVWTSPSTLCTVCHNSTIYSKSGGLHSSGSAFVTPSVSNMQPDTRNCQYCHASAYTKPARPVPSEDAHGFNALTTGGNWPGSNYASRPYAFIRNTQMFQNHRPKQSPEKTNTNGACNLKSGATCSHNNMPTTANDASATYTPGGVY